MADQIKEFADLPQEFVREGVQFINRCQKPDKREFIKISQAVATGFIVMGVIGYIVKLIHIPVNNILVGGA
ncbi:protein translocase SEC6 [Aaosphaeria arxii CBS 175.79]|uniref:Protein translocase SEC6 n=1 Tax=Aaosphaeria arxii CBS 175.79 TaxID=1450172 RepID=A0A6A5YC70_9PLEO|nr:protein translocase SEC6 [Aaosphaeria arxii CBS 175.79]KAF2022171.1 protein translocase SEC6 [Aaosphaeria arxii CBS 175.79]